LGEDENTVVISGCYWYENLVGTVDLIARTITFAPGQTFATYYTFAVATGENDPIVATFKELGTIHFIDWSAWYGGSTYVDEAESTLVKQ